MFQNFFFGLIHPYIHLRRPKSGPASAEKNIYMPSLSLPLYLPELFPTEIRSTGSGVTFNFGRIVSALGVLGTGALVGYFEGDYAATGRITHWIFALGMIVILFAPDTSGKRMDD